MDEKTLTDIMALMREELGADSVVLLNIEYVV